jgi:ribA/ribD-fused uncharacterized protein
MSDLMFNEVPVKGNHYTFGDWKLYAVHDEKNIKGFFGDYRWLSNFHPCTIHFERLVYPSSENAYQAAKLEQGHRAVLAECTPAQSKKEWKKHPLLDNSPEEWNARKYDVMAVILFDKFYRDKGLRQKLLDTGDKYLEETNHWKDQDWGVDVKLGGKNMLGKILMKIRDFWR